MPQKHTASYQPAVASNQTHSQVAADLTVGERLRECRKSLGLTQVELAASLGVTERTITRYESGRSTIPSDVAVQMSTLGIDLGYLFTGQPSTGIDGRDRVRIDMKRLKAAIKRVDGQRSGGRELSDIERLALILREYLHTSDADRTVRSIVRYQSRRTTAA